jgi:exosortase A
MSTVVVNHGQSASEWRRIAVPLGLGVTLLGALFNKELSAAVQTWNTSTAYNHCLLIIPIAIYLLWDRRLDLIGLHAYPMPWALLLGAPLAAAWLVAERLGIMEGRQLVAVSFLELLLLGILGRRLWWAVAGPLLYLYFLVPFGEFLTPQLQDITTSFIRHGLDDLGIPAYIDGYVIDIPQGTFFVAEACAGLRFLISSIAFGSLYSLIMYRSLLRRGLFMLISIVVPIIANGVRALGIVLLGYVLGSAQAAAADHIIYGWVFFSLVILLLIALGLPFRQDRQPHKFGHEAGGAAATARINAPRAVHRGWHIHHRGNQSDRGHCADDGGDSSAQRDGGR